MSSVISLIQFRIGVENFSKGSSVAQPGFPHDLSNPLRHFSVVGSQPETPKAADIIHPSKFIAAQKAPALPPGSEISSLEYLMENNRYQKRVRAMDFADLEP
ncbi:MAG: hypothetical protein ACRD3T_19620 [Terriglobia bacterium]